MSLRETVAPIGPFDDPELWGHPWHGLVKGGTLTLPTAATMEYAQPSGSVAYQRGATSLIDFGAPPVSTPPEDAAQGMEWRSVATLAGAQGQIYGKPTASGSWIYKSASGARWLVRAQNIENRTLAQLNAQAQIQLVRFGEFPADSVTTHLINVSRPASWGQDTPELSGTYGGFPWVADETTIRVRFQQAKPDGSAAIFALDYEPPWAPDEPVAVGFAEIVLSGEGSTASAALNILATREQTAGDRVATPEPTAGVHYGIYRNRTWTGSLEPPCSPRTVYRRESMVMVTADTYEGVEAQIPPQLTNERENGRVGDSYTTGYYRVWPGSMEFSSSGIILGMYYRPNGTIARITLDDKTVIAQSQSGVSMQNNQPWSMRYDLDGSVGGGSCNVTLTFEGNLEYQLNVSATVEATHTITLKSDGAVVASKVRQYSSTRTWTEVQGDARSFTVTWQDAYSPGGYSGTKTSTSTSGWGYIGGVYSPTWSVYGGDLLRPGFFSVWRTPSGETIPWREVPVRYAPAVIGLVEQSPPSAVGMDKPGGVVATPVGAKTVTPPAPFVSGSKALYGSYCPVTHEAVIDTEPVCWV